MTVGEMRKALEGVEDSAKIEIHGECYVPDITSGWLRVEAYPKSVKIKGGTLIYFHGDFRI